MPGINTQKVELNVPLSKEENNMLYYMFDSEFQLCQDVRKRFMNDAKQEEPQIKILFKDDS